MNLKYKFISIEEVSKFKTEVIKHDIEELKLLKWAWGSFFLLGLVLAISGHISWKNKVQIPSNQKLDLELQLLNIDLTLKNREELAISSAAQDASG